MKTIIKEKEMQNGKVIEIEQEENTIKVKKLNKYGQLEKECLYHYSEVKKITNRYKAYIKEEYPMIIYQAMKELDIEFKDMYTMKELNDLCEKTNLSMNVVMHYIRYRK